VRLPEATLVVPEGWSGRTDRTETIVLERSAGDAAAGRGELSTSMRERTEQ
jgi:hypothetical protein